MTDARLPDRWMCDRRLHHLKDCDYRSFIQALMWAVANRTDGVIEPDDVEVIPDFTRASINELIDGGLWTQRSRGGWQFADWTGTQTTRAEHETLEKARARERQKKARQRAKAAATSDVLRGDSPEGTSQGNVPGDYTGRQAGRKEGLEKEPNYVSGSGEKNGDYYFAGAPTTDADGFPLDDWSGR